MALFESLSSMKRDRRSLNRRRFLSFAFAACGVYGVDRWWSRRAKPLIKRMTSYVTGNEEFFAVSIKPGFRPSVDESEFRLLLSGPGLEEWRMSLREIQALPSETFFRTLMCIGNPVGGRSVGNAEWTGVRLAEILRPLVSEPNEGLFVSFFGLDGFHSSIPLEVALDPETYLVYTMNGVPLPAKHGFPLRVLLPGRYGMKQPRWIERIEVSSSASGYWEAWGWSSKAEVRTMSRVDSFEAVNEGLHEIRGIAYCGKEAVSRVEVSVDDGSTWHEASLEDPARSGCWRRWKFLWKEASAGEHVLQVRATDSQGKQQEESRSGSYPSGATGLHRVTVEVRKG